MSETEALDVVDRLAIVYGSTRDYRTGVHGQQLGQEMYQIIGSGEALSAIPDAMDEIRRLRRELDEARKAIPPELFDGMEVYVEAAKSDIIRPEHVSAVLDAAVRLIRKRIRSAAIDAASKEG